MLQIICKHNQNTMQYQKYENGIQELGTAKDVNDFYAQVKQWEDSRMFENEDGTIVDGVSGIEVFDPKYPNEFDFGDYSYRLIEE